VALTARNRHMRQLAQNLKRSKGDPSVSGARRLLQQAVLCWARASDLLFGLSGTEGLKEKQARVIPSSAPAVPLRFTPLAPLQRGAKSQGVSFPDVVGGQDEEYEEEEDDDPPFNCCRVEAVFEYKPLREVRPHSSGDRHHVFAGYVAELAGCIPGGGHLVPQGPTGIFAGQGHEDHLPARRGVPPRGRHVPRDSRGPERGLQIHGESHAHPPHAVRPCVIKGGAS
jgi:hypothetical protein